MKTLAVVLLAILLTSCSIYKIKTERDASGILKTKVSVYSSREIEQIGGAYGRDGPDAYFDFNAQGVTQPGPEDYIQAIGAGIQLGRGQVPVKEDEE